VKDSPDRAEVVVVGGGIAGAATALRLARRGRDVLLLERSPAWRWRAGGVFSSPAAMRELRALSLPVDVLAAAALPIPAMRVETRSGVAFRLTYGAERPGGEPPVGLDRSTLDPALLAAAEAAGVRVVRDAHVDDVDLRAQRPRVSVGVGPAKRRFEVEGGVVVGADGLRSTVARAARATRPPRLGSRVGLTFHLANVDASTDGRARPDARMVVLPGAYCGIAPVPGDRVNVGIVLIGEARRRQLAAEGPRATVDAILREVPPAPDGLEPWRAGEVLDSIEGASPLGTRVSRRAGHGWLLAGDAAGFLDPFTGEGLHRALVSARLAAAAVDAYLADGHPAAARAGALAGYERSMAARFAGKDLVSLIVQRFLEHDRLFEYAARRLAGRDGVRATMGLVMGDLVPASRGLDPRFLATLLAPVTLPAAALPPAASRRRGH